MTDHTEDPEGSVPDEELFDPRLDLPKRGEAAKALPYAGIWETFCAALNNDNTYVVYWNDVRHSMPRNKVDGFYAFDHIRKTKYEPFHRLFEDVHNPEALQLVKTMIDERLERAKRLEATPLWLRGPMQFAANTLDWPTALQGGWILRGVRVSASGVDMVDNVTRHMRVTGPGSGLVNRAGGGALEGGLQSVLQEHVLAGLLGTRQNDEIWGNVGGSVFLGMLPGTAKSLAPRQWNAAVRALKGGTGIRVGATAGLTFSGPQLIEPSYPTNAPNLSDSESSVEPDEAPQPAPSPQKQPAVWAEPDRTVIPDSLRKEGHALNPVPPANDPAPDPVPAPAIEPATAPTIDNKKPVGTEEEE